MKKQIRNHSLLSMVLLSMVLLTITLFSPGCSKDESGNGQLVTITTIQAVKGFQNADSNIVLSANITSDGGSSITERGFVFGTNPNPSISNSSDSVKKSAGPGVGNHSETLAGFEANTTYYARAYAINTSGTAYSDQVSFIFEVQFGSRFGGGIVIFVDGTGKHGLITARNGLGETATWGCEGVAVPGTQTAIGTGEANTTLIANSCSEAGIAARFCLDLVHNGYDDWFLPSKDELNLMYLNRNQAVGLFSTATRLSSSQNDENTAWAQKFDASGAQLTTPKNTVSGVRPMRAF